MFNKACIRNVTIFMICIRNVRCTNRVVYETSGTPNLCTIVPKNHQYGQDDFGSSNTAWQSHREKKSTKGKVIFEISRKNDVHNNYETDYKL